MKPTEFTKYNGEQLILTSDRIIFNSKVDSIFVISNETIGFSANDSVHFNVGKKNSKNGLFIINSAKIQLGMTGKGSKLESVTKADSLESILNDLLNAISSFARTLSNANGTGSGVVALIPINIAANVMGQQISVIKKRVKDIKSKTSYTI